MSASNTARFLTKEKNHGTEAKQACTEASDNPALRALIAAGTERGRSLRAAALQPGVDEDLQRVAEAYNQKYGLEPPKHTGYADIDVDLAKQMADAYEQMQHDPNDPEVRKAYTALAKEVEQQWNHAHEHGYVMEPWTQEGQPYNSSKEMADDVRNNKHLYYFQGGDMPEDHPMNGKMSNGMVVNDAFRGIHDLYGHAKGGYQFGPRGEENAYLAHRDMFSKDAIPAMTTETKGQNSWVNFGKHIRRADGSIPKQGDPDYVHPADRPYADQKAGVVESGLRSQLQSRQAGMKPSVPDTEGRVKSVKKSMASFLEKKTKKL